LEPAVGQDEEPGERTGGEEVLFEYEAFFDHLGRLRQKHENKIAADGDIDEEVEEFTRSSLRNWVDERPDCIERTTKLTEDDFLELFRVVEPSLKQMGPEWRMSMEFIDWFGLQCYGR
jgi:hypothetical protein